MDGPDGGMPGEESLERYFKTAATARYQGVELGFHDPRGLDRVGPLLRETGLELAAAVYSGALATAPYAREEKAIARHAEAVRRMGGDILVYGEADGMPFSRGNGDTQGERREYAEKITTMAGFLREALGVRLVYRHHGRAAGSARDFLLETGDDVGVSLDTRALGGMRADFIRALGPRIRLVHVAGRNAPGVAEAERAAGGGAVVGLLADAEYTGWVVAEHLWKPGRPFRFDGHEFVDTAARHGVPWWEV